MARRAQSSRGFTLIEVIVVIGLLVIVAGLLIPAIGGIRDGRPGRRRSCANHLQQLSAAVVTFEQIRGRFPGSRELLARKGSGPGRDKEATWNAVILPYIDQNPLYEQWNDPQVRLYEEPRNRNDETPLYVEQLVPSLPMYRCSADATLQDKHPLLTGVPPDNSYVANGGFLPRPAADPSPYSFNPDSYRRAMNKYNGVFHDLIAKPSARFTYEMLKDGASNTAMLSENLQAGWWCVTGGLDEFGGESAYRNRLATVFHYLYAPAPQLSAGQPKPTLAVTNEMRINGEKERLLLAPSTARPSSQHKGGVNMVFCDRSVKFIHENIDYHVYVALLTPYDRKADVPWREYLLKAEDYLQD